MRDIEPASEYGSVLTEDVVNTIKDLRGGYRYAAADLYARYCDVAKEADRLPGHPVAFGQELRRQGMLRRQMTVGGSGRGGKGGRGRQVSGWQM